MGVEYEHFVLPRQRDLRPTTEAVTRLVAALRREHWVIAPDHPLFEELAPGINTPRGVSENTGGNASSFGPNPAYPQDPSTFVVDRSKIKRGLPRREAIPSPMDVAFLDDRLDDAHPSPLAREIVLAFPVAPLEHGEGWAESLLEYPFTFGGEDTTNYHQIEIILADDFVSHGFTNAFRAIDDACACGAALRYQPDDDFIEYVTALTIDARIRRTCPRCGAIFDPSTRSAPVRNGWDGTTSELRGGITYRFGVRIDCHKGWPREQAPIVLRAAFRELVERVLDAPFEDVGGLD